MCKRQGHAEEGEGRLDPVQLDLHLKLMSGGFNQVVKTVSLCSILIHDSRMSINDSQHI